MARTDAVPSSAIDAAVRVVLKDMTEGEGGVGEMSFSPMNTPSPESLLEEMT